MLMPNSIDDKLVQLVRDEMARCPDILRLAEIIKTYVGEDKWDRRALYLVLMKTYNVSIGQIKCLGAWHGFAGGTWTDEETNLRLLEIRDGFTGATSSRIAGVARKRKMDPVVKIWISLCVGTLLLFFFSGGRHSNGSPRATSYCNTCCVSERVAAR